MFAKVKPNTRIIGQNIIYFNRIASTNSFALDLIKQNMAQHGTVVVAEYQNQGRGQGSKFWLSEPYENILFSIVLHPVTSNEHYPFSLNKAITLAVLKAIEKHLPGQTIHIKWPNDILSDSGKICGILVENNYSGQKLNWSIAGIGINVNQNFDLHPDLNAVSMKTLLGGDDLSRESVLQTVLESVEHYFSLLEDGKSEDIQREFDRNLLGFEEWHTYYSEGRSFNGILKGCDKEGRIILETENKEILKFVHGSIKQEIHYAKRGN